MSDVAKQHQSGLERTTVTIASGASLSDASDGKGKTLVGVEMPSAWTAAALSFMVSNDGSTYVPLYDQGVEVTIPSSLIGTAEARSFALDPTQFLGFRYVKVRSGVNGAAVNQGAERVITLVWRPM